MPRNRHSCYRSPFRVIQFRVEQRAERDRVFEPARRAERVTERDAQLGAACDDAAQPLWAKQTAPNEPMSDSESNYDTDTELVGIDDDDSPSTVDTTKLPTFSIVRTLHESADIVRVASFPPPPAVDPGEPTAVDWNSATRGRPTCAGS